MTTEKKRKYRRRDRSAYYAQLSAWAGSAIVAAPVSMEKATSDHIIADEALRRFGPDPDYNPKYADCRFWESACEEMLKEESKWRQLHQTFAWIDEKPVWVNATSWEIIAGLAEPTKPCTRHFRLSLIGGGQVKVTEEFRLRKYKDMEPWLTCYDRRHLRVQAETEEGLRTVSGA